MEDVKVTEKQDGPYRIRIVQKNEGEGQRIKLTISRPQSTKLSVWERFLDTLGVGIN